MKNSLKKQFETWEHVWDETCIICKGEADLKLYINGYSTKFVICLKCLKELYRILKDFTKLCPSYFEEVDSK